jgi:hypothetical protein
MILLLYGNFLFAMTKIRCLHIFGMIGSHNQNVVVAYTYKTTKSFFLCGNKALRNVSGRYFRGEFTQSHVSTDKFDKEYVYGIRYPANVANSTIVGYIQFL